MTLLPLGDRIVLKKLDKADIKSVLDLTRDVDAVKPEEAVVVTVSDGVVFNGKEIKADDRVIFSKHAGICLKMEDQEYFVINKADVWAIVTE